MWQLGPASRFAGHWSDWTFFANKTIVSALRVAFKEHTETMLLLEWILHADNVVWLVSYGRNGSEWLEVTRLSTMLSTSYEYNEPVISVYNSRVLLSDWETNTVYVFDVNANNSVNRAVATIKRRFRSLAWILHSSCRRYARCICTLVFFICFIIASRSRISSRRATTDALECRPKQILQAFVLRRHASCGSV